MMPRTLGALVELDYRHQGWIGVALLSSQPLGAVLPWSRVTSPLTIPTSETGRGWPSPEPVAHPGTPAPTPSVRFRQTLPPILSQHQKPVPGLTPGTTWYWVVTALGVGGHPCTGMEEQQAGGFTGLGKVTHPKCPVGCPKGEGSWPGMHCRGLAPGRV